MIGIFYFPLLLSKKMRRRRSFSAHNGTFEKKALSSVVGITLPSKSKMFALKASIK
jgi:hypothetical protein